MAVLIEGGVRLAINRVRGRIENDLVKRDLLAEGVDAFFFVGQIIERDEEDAGGDGREIHRRGKLYGGARADAEAIELIEERGFLAGGGLGCAIG